MPNPPETPTQRLVSSSSDCGTEGVQPPAGFGGGLGPSAATVRGETSNHALNGGKLRWQKENPPPPGYSRGMDHTGNVDRSSGGNRAETDRATASLGSAWGEVNEKLPGCFCSKFLETTQL